MARAQCPHCKKISSIPTKLEGQERPCVKCGQSYVRIFVAEEDFQQETQDFPIHRTMTAPPKPRKTPSAIKINREPINKKIINKSKQQLYKPTQPVQKSPIPEINQTKISDYSGFWRRVAAQLIDGIVLIPISFLLPALKKGLMLDAFLKGIELGSFVPFAMAAFLEIAFNLLMIAIFWLYFAKMHCSSKQATLGKMVMGIIVVDANEKKLSFARATGRHFATMLSTITGVGLLMPAFTKRKQALHDKIANTLVIKSNKNDSSRYIRIIIKIAIIYTGIFLFSIGCSYLSYQFKYHKIDKQKMSTEQLTEKISSIFIMPEELGDFEIMDFTDAARAMSRDKKVEFSLTWSIDHKHSKQWDKMSQSEKDKFNQLKKSVVTALAVGVKKLDGTFKVEYNKYTNGQYGDWEQDESGVHWRVHYTFSPQYPGPDDLPEISVFIGHSKIIE